MANERTSREMLDECRAMLFTRSASPIVVDPRLQTEYLDAFYAFSLKFHDVRLYCASQTAQFLEPLDREDAQEALQAYQDWIDTNHHRPLVRQLVQGQAFIADNCFGGRPPLPALVKLRKAGDVDGAEADHDPSPFAQIREAILADDEDADLEGLLGDINDMDEGDEPPASGVGRAHPEDEEGEGEPWWA